ncbi:MAG: PspC domain-containing protein [Alistipes sp.]|nr:PspC domain-containing protein [Alistipes sp.]
MNEVKKCSLSGIAFSLDTEAYNELQNYLKALKESYKSSADGAEIVADIEARIAELILSTQESSRVVELPLVKNIIAQLGTPEDIKGDEEEQPTHAPIDRNPRRLYRDMENAKLGGVCAGIARYFDTDPVWIRCGLFAPLLLSCLGHISWLNWFASVSGNLFGVFIVCYLVMWFAVPVARTARQKLEMNGEPITARNIASSAAALDIDAKAKSVVASTVSTAGKVALLVMKLFAGLLVFALVMVACALMIGLFVVVVGGHELMPTDMPMSLAVLAIFIPLIPAILMIYILMCLIASRHSNGKVLIVGLIVWILTIMGCIGVALRKDVAPRLIDGLNFKTEQLMKEQIEVNGQNYTIEELIEKVENEGAITIEEDSTKRASADSKIKINVTEGDKGADFTIEAGGNKLIEVKVNEK